MWTQKDYEDWAHELSYEHEFSWWNTVGKTELEEVKEAPWFFLDSPEVCSFTKWFGL